MVSAPAVKRLRPQPTLGLLPSVDLCVCKEGSQNPQTARAAATQLALAGHQAMFGHGAGGGNRDKGGNSKGGQVGGDKQGGFFTGGFGSNNKKPAVQGEEVASGIFFTTAVSVCKYTAAVLLLTVTTFSVSVGGARAVGTIQQCNTHTNRKLCTMTPTLEHRRRWETAVYM